MADKNLFGGELLIKDSGIFTKSHIYKHPEAGMIVKLIGMDHSGCEDYFLSISKELDSCQKVLFEASSGTKETLEENIKNIFNAKQITAPKNMQLSTIIPKLYKNKQKKNSIVARALNKIEKTDIFSAYAFTIRTYFVYSSVFHNLVDEGSSFDYKKEGWESVDMLIDEETGKKLEQSFIEAISQLPQEKITKTIEYVINKIKRIDLKQHKIRELGDTYFQIYHDPLVVETFLSTWGKPRDEYLFEKFDEVIQGTKLQVIGIKYGAGHISNQRKLLEARGYNHQKTKTFQVIKF